MLLDPTEFRVRVNKADPDMWYTKIWFSPAFQYRWATSLLSVYLNKLRFLQS